MVEKSLFLLIDLVCLRLLHIAQLLKMTVVPNPAIFPFLKLIRTTLLESDLQIIKHLEILVQVALPLLVLFGEKLIEVRQHVLVDVIKIVVC